MTLNYSFFRIPMACEAPGGPTAPGTVFRFAVPQAWKVCDKGHLDYWAYEVSLETDSPVLVSEVADARTTGGPAKTLSTIHAARRYSDFVWLRAAAADIVPGWILPPLPGLSVEGVLEKVDALVLNGITSEGHPPLVAQRMAGLELFLQCITGIPPLRESDVMVEFLHCSPKEMLGCQDRWQQRNGPPDSAAYKPSLTTALWLWLRRPFTDFRQVDPLLEAARQWATDVENSLAVIKAKLEQMWDTLMLEREPQESKRPNDQYKIADPTLNALLNISAQAHRAATDYSRRNEELLTLLLVDTGFLYGLCQSVRSAVDEIEMLERMECSLAETGKSAPELSAALARRIANFTAAHRLLPAQRKRVMQRVLRHFAELGAILDPGPFPWGPRCLPHINAIPTVSD